MFIWIRTVLLMLVWVLFCIVMLLLGLFFTLIGLGKPFADYCSRAQKWCEQKYK